MEDEKIITLYWQREQRAIYETDRKYGDPLRGISFNILSNREDAEECVSDTYLALWDSIPPKCPGSLRAYAAAILRNLSLKRVRERSAKKRGGGELPLALSELEEYLGSGLSLEREYEQKEFAAWISNFLYTLPSEDRKIFMYRYWLFASIGEIANKLGCSQSKVKSSLYRTRQKLQKHLEKEGLI